MLWCHTCHGEMGCPFGGIDDSKVLDLCLCLCYGLVSLSLLWTKTNNVAGPVVFNSMFASNSFST